MESLQEAFLARPLQLPDQNQLLRPLSPVLLHFEKTYARRF